MCHPFAVRHFHICKNRAEGRVLRAAGVNAKIFFPLPRSGDRYASDGMSYHLPSTRYKNHLLCGLNGTTWISHGQGFRWLPSQNSRDSSPRCPSAGRSHFHIQQNLSASFHCPDRERFHTGQSGDGCQKIRFSPGKKRRLLPCPFAIRVHYHCGNGNRFFATDPYEVL